MELSIIVAFCKKFGLGKDSTLPWNIKEDLINFRNITKGHIVIMGRKTFFSLPENVRPLKDRLNIVITRDPFKYDEGRDLIFTNIESIPDLLSGLKHLYKKAFVIGGAEIYSQFIDNCKYLYITQIDKLYNCDTFFPQFTNYNLIEYSNNLYSENEKCNYRFLKFKKVNKIHQEYTYLNLLKNIKTNGDSRDDRTGTGTIGIFGHQIHLNIEDSIPLLTTKFVSWKTIVEELLWFLRGDTNSKYLENKGIRIWEGNTTRDFLDKRGLSSYEDGDIGPMYGFNWRHCGTIYEGSSSTYENKGLDQFMNVVNMLKTDPFSRRIIMTTYDPNVLEQGVLHPCHGLVFQLYVTEKNGIKYLSGSMYQRSCDTFLGFPINIGSYSTLIYILAKMTNMKPKELIISLGDTHIYKNHLEQVNTQLERTPYPFPKLFISDNIKSKPIEAWTSEDFELVGYLYHPMIRAPMAV